MKETISMLVEEFINEKTNEKVEGVTILVDGILKEALEILKEKNQKYENTAELIQDALMKGLEIIKNESYKK